MQWLPLGNQFVSGSADKSLILWMFVLISSNEIRVYDMARKSDELFLKTAHPISCLSISSSGKYLLVNLLQQSEILCVEIATGSTVARYRGLREQRYVLRPCFGGAHDELVMSGSEGKSFLLAGWMLSCL
ncbi:hypothetical protein BBJ28_00010305 [Nothophytophthora sp. Chile5]|nr:hypothetical protein BBJ28_00010305 [Nothophytophthora sp. Chile5]